MLKAMKKISVLSVWTEKGSTRLPQQDERSKDILGFHAHKVPLGKNKHSKVTEKCPNKITAMYRSAL